ncbi:MAG: hypothetical protein CL607_09415 [Anaerolineaceae bacterium]|nr:hypothetical protein [Anaerolineaceae bacterium]
MYLNFAHAGLPLNYLYYLVWLASTCESSFKHCKVYLVPNPETLFQQHTFHFYVIDDFIDVYSLKDARRVTMDAYVAKAHERYGLANQIEAYSYTIYDVSSVTLPTPYAVAKASEIASISRFGESSAIVTPNSLLIFVRSIINRVMTRGVVKNRFFTELDEAVAWLHEERTRVESDKLGVLRH